MQGRAAPIAQTPEIGPACAGGRALSVAVLGATGAVGQEFLSLIAQRRFPVGRLKLLASPRSAGRQADVPGVGRVPIEAPAEGCLDGVDIAFLSAGSSLSRQWAPVALRAGAWAIDNSSAFRADPAAVLAIPAVNGGELDAAMAASAGPRVVAVPNCSTVIALMAVSPLRKAAPVRRMVISTYQAVSGAGAAAMAELEEQARDWAHGRMLRSPVLGRPALFNVFSHNSAVGPDGSNEEERKLLTETRRIWNDPHVRVAATCVRVPVLRAHCESIAVEFTQPIAGTHEAAEARVRELLDAAEGVEVVDDRAGGAFPEPRHAAGRDPVLAGRIRADRSLDPGMGVMLFVAGDQLRIGAALTGMHIAERLVRAGAFSRSG